MRVAARQSCLGTVSCGAVMFGEVRQSGRVVLGTGLAGCVAVGLVWARQSRRCKLWRGEVWCGWPGLGSRGEVHYVAASRGIAGHVKAVMSRFGFVWCGVAVEASCGEVWRCKVWRVMARQSRQVQMRQSMDWRGGAVKASSGKVGCVESRFGMARNGRAVKAGRVQLR